MNLTVCPQDWMCGVVVQWLVLRMCAVPEVGLHPWERRSPISQHKSWSGSQRGHPWKPLPPQLYWRRLRYLVRNMSLLASWWGYLFERPFAMTHQILQHILWHQQYEQSSLSLLDHIWENTATDPVRAELSLCFSHQDSPEYGVVHSRNPFSI